MKEPKEKECSYGVKQPRKQEQFKSLRYGLVINPTPKQKKKKRTPDDTVVKCEGCHYYRQIVESTKIWCCNYCLDTGKLRGIPPIDCYKRPGTPYKPVRRKRRK